MDQSASDDGQSPQAASVAPANGEFDSSARRDLHTPTVASGVEASPAASVLSPALHSDEPKTASSAQPSTQDQRVPHSSASAKIRFLLWPFTTIEYTVTRQLETQADRVREDKRNYLEKLEAADREQVFKYVLLTNLSALEEYILQTRIQAQQSFQLSKLAAAAGFLLITAGIALGVYFDIKGGVALTAAYLATASGALSEFISGVLLFMYSRTLQQVNRFHDRLVASQQVSLAFLASDLVTDDDSRNKSKRDLAKTLMEKVYTGKIDNEISGEG